VGRTDKSHINQYLKTGLANSGRAAGMGILYDRYDDESGGPKYGGSVQVKFPSDGLTQEELQALNGKVITYKTSKEAAHEAP